MEKCVCCGQETSSSAAVYLKAQGAPPVKRAEFFCSDCVKKQSGGFSPIIFYLALQLCWLTVLKTGLFTPIGILAACIALVGLWRLAALAAARISGRAGGQYSPEDASEALKRILLKQENSAGGQILSLREYRRLYGQERL